MKAIRNSAEKSPLSITLYARLCLVFACLLLIGSLAMGSSAYAGPIVYPAKGQSQDQQNKDQWECHQWAVKQTGVDPQNLAAQTSSGEVYQRHHSALGGAARGSLLGVVGGAIAGDAGKGAAIGAGVGAVAGRMRARQDVEMTQQVNANAAAEQQAQLHKYDRAYGACLEGRGYTVK